MKEIYDTIKDRFRLTDFSQPHAQQAWLYAPADQAVALITHLRDIHGFSHLVMLTCVDWIEQGQFQLTYILHNYQDHKDLGVKVLIERLHPVMESIHLLWEQARTYQRELYEMFGISFPGSPGMTDPFILEGWDDMPVMRRDFDTKAYSDTHYSHRPREIHEPEEHMKQRLYPED